MVDLLQSYTQRCDVDRDVHLHNSSERTLLTHLIEPQLTWKVPTKNERK